MKVKITGLLVVFLFLAAAFSGQTAAADLAAEQTLAKQVLILGSFKDYKDALNSAQKNGQLTGLPYSSRGMVFDTARGLIWPDNYEDEIYAGSYSGRRYTDECGGDVHACLTIEKSDFYAGMQPGYYIVVAGIYDEGDKSGANSQLQKLKKIVPDAYLKSTKIYMGCMH